jgi:hypothetical protein
MPAAAAGCHFAISPPLAADDAAILRHYAIAISFFFDIFDYFHSSF